MEAKEFVADLVREMNELFAQLGDGVELSQSRPRTLHLHVDDAQRTTTTLTIDRTRIILRNMF